MQEQALLGQAEAKVENLSAEITALQKATAEGTAAHQVELVSKLQELTVVQKQKDHLAVQFAKGQQALKKAQTKQAATEAKLAELTAAQAAGQSSIAKMKALHSKEIGILRENMAQVRKALTAKEVELTDVSGALAIMTKREGEARGVLHAKAGLEEELTQERSKLSAVKGELAAAQTQVRQNKLLAEKAVGARTEVKDALVSMQGRFDALVISSGKKLSERDAKIADLMKQMQTMQAENAKLQSVKTELQSVTAEAKTLRASVLTQKDKATTAENTLAQKAGQLELVQKQLESMRARLERLPEDMVVVTSEKAAPAAAAAPVAAPAAAAPAPAATGGGWFSWGGS